MPVKNYHGVGEVFAGTQSLGRFRYQIDVVTDVIPTPACENRLPDLESHCEVTGWLDIGHALQVLAPRTGETLRLQLEDGQRCDFCITRITLTGSSAVPITITGPIH